MQCWGYGFGGPCKMRIGFVEKYAGARLARFKSSMTESLDPFAVWHCDWGAGLNARLFSRFQPACRRRPCCAGPAGNRRSLTSVCGLVQRLVTHLGDRHTRQVGRAESCTAIGGCSRGGGGGVGRLNPPRGALGRAQVAGDGGQWGQCAAGAGGLWAAAAVGTLRGGAQLGVRVLQAGVLLDQLLWQVAPSL